MNQSELEQIHVVRAKRGKTRAGKSLILVLLLIGRERGARFFSQSQTEICNLMNQSS